MSEDSHETKRADEAAAAEKAEVRAEEKPEQANPETAAPEDELTTAQAQAEEFRERYLRAVAELENYRRRAEKERQDTAKFAIASFARDMLTMLDNLRRGLESVSADERKDNPQLETLAAGMELTEREMLSTLERHGIEKVDPEGAPFDHNFHQAMMEVEDPSVPAGTVAQVMQAGYVINGRLLRPAMVVVAKGGPKAGPASEGEKVQAPIANEEVTDDTGADTTADTAANEGDEATGDGTPSGDRTGE